MASGLSIKWNFHSSSHPSSLNLHRFSSSTGLAQSPKRQASVAVSFPRVQVAAHSSFYCLIRLPLKRSRNIQEQRRRSGYDVARANIVDDDPFDGQAIDDTMAGYMLSSDGEYSDGDLALNSLSDEDLALNSLSDEDLPLEEALAKASHRCALRGKGFKRHRGQWAHLGGENSIFMWLILNSKSK